MPGARRAFRSVDRRVSRWTLRGPRTHGTDDRATRGSRLDVRYGRHLVFAGVVRPDRTVLVIVAAAVWLGCSRLASKEEERTGREFLAHVARGEPIPPARTDASLRTPEASARLAVLQDQLHGVDAASAERVGVGSMHGPDDRTLVFFDFAVTGKRWARIGTSDALERRNTDSGRPSCPRPDHRRQSSTDDTSRSWSRPGLDQPYPRADGYAHRAGAAVAGATEP